MKNVLFLGSKPIGYETLNYLITNASEMDINIVGVLSNDNLRFGKDFSVRALAEDNKILFIENLADILTYPNVDFIISVQYHLILKQEHIDVARKLAINLHMAPLPEYRGCNQFSFAIFNESKVFGTTLHRLESGIDNGDIIFESRFDIPTNSMVKELYDLTFEKSVELFKNHIGDIFSDNYKLNNQESYFDERGTNLYYRKDIQKLKSIDLGPAKNDVIKRVRATAMPGFEPPHTIVDGKKYYIIPEEHYT